LILLDRGEDYLMPTFPFMQVDAFTTQRLAGNPCAVLFEADNLTDDEMLAIAREMNLAETAFVMKSNQADFRARYFTPALEIPMAGHPTIATVHALVESGRLPLSGNETEISLELQAGLFPVEIIAMQGDIQQIIMTQNKPIFMSNHDPDQVMPLFGLTPQDLVSERFPIQTVSTGTPQLMIPVKELGLLRSASLDIPAFIEYRAQSDFFSAHLFCLKGVTSSGDTFARHLDAPPDLLEDPFTGSANGGMAAYLWHHRMIDQPTFIAEQGHWLNRPGQARVEVVGSREDIQSVKVGGQAVTVVRGDIIL
jgi:trans-2,3-dihydro-3-hydroxyanthranilate isomerase